MRIKCVGAIIVDAAGRLLLIQRGHPPGEGLWSLPGGRVEAGESDDAALIREMLEETSLTIAVGDLAGTVDRPGPGHGETVYEIHDYHATVVAGTLRAGDDAADARWYAPDELARIPVTDGLLDALTRWRVIGGPSSVYQLAES